MTTIRTVTVECTIRQFSLHLLPRLRCLLPEPYEGSFFSLYQAVHHQGERSGQGQCASVNQDEL